MKEKGVKDYEKVVFAEKGEIKTMVLSYVMGLIAAIAAVPPFFTLQDTLKVCLVIFHTGTFDQSMTNSGIMILMGILLVIGMIVMFFLLQHYFDNHMKDEPKKCLKVFFTIIIVEIAIFVLAVLIKHFVKA